MKRQIDLIMSLEWIFIKLLLILFANSEINASIQQKSAVLNFRNLRAKNIN